MFVNSIDLQNFRNYEHLRLDSFGPVNLLIGQNAQGKTNLAEAIFVLALTKSHRTSRDKELIRFGEERARLAAEVDKKYGSVKLELSLSQQGKKAKINGLEQRKLSDFVGALNVVMFAPEDLEIVKGTPGSAAGFLTWRSDRLHQATCITCSNIKKCSYNEIICLSSYGEKGHQPRPCLRCGTSNWWSTVLKSSKKETIHKETAKVGRNDSSGDHRRRRSLAAGLPSFLQRSR